MLPFFQQFFRRAFQPHVDAEFALALVAYHRQLGTRVPDGDMGFRCRVCGKPLVARESRPMTPAHFEHMDSSSTCRPTSPVDLRRAMRSETLAQFLTPAALAAILRHHLTKISGEGDEMGDGDARVRSPLRPAPFGRDSFASVPEPDDDVFVAAVANPPRKFNTRTS